MTLVCFFTKLVLSLDKQFLWYVYIIDYFRKKWRTNIVDIIKSYLSNHLLRILNKIVKEIIYNLQTKISTMFQEKLSILPKVPTTSIKILNFPLVDPKPQATNTILSPEIKWKELLLPILMSTKFILGIRNPAAFKKVLKRGTVLSSKLIIRL